MCAENYQNSDRSDSDSDSDLLNIVARRLKIKNTNSDNNTTLQYKKTNSTECNVMQRKP